MTKLSRAGSAFASALIIGTAFAQNQHPKVLYPSGQGVAESQAVIDTRIGPQISDVHGFGETYMPENPMLRKQHSIDLKTKLESMSLRAGEVAPVVRTFVERLFPGIVQDQWQPPDCTLAVGPDYVVATTNMKIGFFRKSDGALVFLRWLGNQESQGFFNPVGALNFTFDPRCLYDRNTGRFIVMCAEEYSGPNRSLIDIAVSDDSDPNGVWYLYRASILQVIGGQQFWLDYPSLAVDNNAIYVNGNLFGFNSGFGGVVYRIMPLAPLLSGGAMTFTDIRDSNSGSVQGGPHIGVPNAAFFVEDWGGTQMMVHAIKDSITNPTLWSQAVNVPSYSYPNSSSPQLGGGSIDVLDGRVFVAGWKAGSLVTSHAIRVGGSGNRTVGRWYEFNTGNWPQSGSVSLVQSGNVDTGNSTYALFPVVALNDFKDIGMEVGRCSGSQYASVGHTGRKFTDPLGQMGSFTEVKVGNAPFTGGRWGDYFGIQVDPNDGLTFWGVGEYCDGGPWATWIDSWKVAQYANLTVRAIQGANGSVPVSISITTDGRGNGNGNTPLTRTYYSGTNVDITAPASFNGHPFRSWIFGPGVPGPTNPHITINLTSDRTITAYYDQ